MPKAVMRLRRSRAALDDNSTSPEVRALIAALDGDDGTLRHSARDSLVAIGKPAVQSLIEALRYPGERPRWEAAKALGEIRDKASAPALVLALEDKSAGIRWLAAEGLIALGRHSLPPLLPALAKRAGSIWLREGALHVLRRLAYLGLGDQTRLVVAALEGPAPAVAVPLAAGDAIEKLRRARRRRLLLRSAGPGHRSGLQ